MSVNKIPLAALFAAALFSQTGLEAQAQLAPSSGSVAISAHEDLLACYQSLGKNAETEAEFRWLIQQAAGKAVLHFNYACFLQRAGKTGAAAVEYKKAATLEPSNIDYVGSYGQMALFQKNYMEAYNYLGRAMQMPGGEKYKAAVESCRTYIQQQQQQQMINQMNKKNASGAAAAPGKKPRDDDDD
ncbi:MAG: hypothetical protein JSS86_00990 [Cyanobacteria bacterium SZAS LIN-2]|nr:hypothetical protein [Cyanobacteria bacterium SZAS LIN-3]MBS1994846.1 hypothetical protein [Cyanobacteria bacterium SZAS LIN-2]